MSSGFRLEYPSAYLSPPESWDGLTQWTYGSRRIAQQITDHIWLGPSSVLKDGDFLQLNNISCIISMTHPRIRLPKLSVEHVSIVPIRSLNRANSDIDMADLKLCSSAVSDHTRSNGNVLVVCETGNTHAVAGICAYLIEYCGLDLTRAFQSIQCKRFSILLDDALIYLLLSLENAVAATNRTVGVQHMKRTLSSEDNLKVRKRRSLSIDL